MLILRSADLIVRLDPRRGAEIVDLIELASGRQLLGRMPWGSTSSALGDIDEDTWLAASRGGWQVVFPNAGGEARVGSDAHSFHGNASHEPWEVVASSPHSAELRWRGKGLRATRTVTVEAGVVAVEMQIAGEGRRSPYVALEHLAFGHELIDPGATVEMPAARAIESGADGPVTAPADAARWPSATLADGTVGRVDRLELAETVVRFITVHDLEDGFAAIRPDRDAPGVVLRWDAGVLPHAWIWHETRHSGGAFREMTEVLGIEPSSVPHALGLAAAVEHGQARWAEPGRPDRYRISVEVTPARAEAEP